jgi:hypothetical protein
MCMVPAMSNHQPAYDPSVWLFVVLERIGSDLTEKYRPAEKLPPAWFSMLSRLYEKLEAPDHDIKGEFEILT